MLNDAVAVIGFAMVMVGLWMFHPSLALIIGGATLVWVGVQLRRHGERSRDGQ